jgi:hypothetical protein
MRSSQDDQVFIFCFVIDGWFLESLSRLGGVTEVTEACSSQRQIPNLFQIVTVVDR